VLSTAGHKSLRKMRADARTRTGDPFITSVDRVRKVVVGRPRMGSVRGENRVARRVMRGHRWAVVADGIYAFYTLAESSALRRHEILITRSVRREAVRGGERRKPTLVAFAALLPEQRKPTGVFQHDYLGGGSQLAPCPTHGVPRLVLGLLVVRERKGRTEALTIQNPNRGRHASAFKPFDSRVQGFISWNQDCGASIRCSPFGVSLASFDECSLELLRATRRIAIDDEVIQALVGAYHPGIRRNECDEGFEPPPATRHSHP
jgi:hypothetical protein